MSPSWSSFDFHMHTLHSKDGMVKPRSLFKLMKRKGLRGLAPTEHWKPSTLRIIEKNDRFIIPACEFKTSDYGEIIGLFLSEEIDNRSFEEVCDDIHAQGGLAILPHPCDPLRKHTAVRKKLPEELIIKHVDLIEGINSRCIINLFNTRAQQLAKRLGKPLIAGSDGHSFLEVGNARTWLRDISTAEDIYNALKKGRTQISGHCSIFLYHIPTMIWQRARKIAYD